MDPAKSEVVEAPDVNGAREESHSAVTWGAVSAGAVVWVALSFVLLDLGAGFGMKLGWAWPSTSPSLAGFEPVVGVWLVVVQVLSGALGGYLAGRLRTKWRHVHDHEVFFRDTAHGLIVWGLSTVTGVVLAALSVHAADAAPPTEEVTQQFALFMTMALLLGAFVAAVAAALGGMRRDEMHKKYRS